MNKPELLSPAGSGPAMVAAVQCGADAIYLGAGDFNARKSADNFEDELAGAVGYCHARGVKVYVTLNTMVRQDELARLEATIEKICCAGADGAIVQDLGVVRILRQMAPQLPLHASTQMAVHNPQGVDFLVKNGFKRVVLAREMTHEEIARCAGRGAELEVFIHGALCVSCSGQCLMSSMIGGRSGNRGLCAQPCRLPYRLNDRQGYLLSTKDLCSLDDLAALIQAGASSLKIEGRLKRPEYVAVTTKIYRQSLDALAADIPFDTTAARKELAQMFNRGGFTRGYGPGLRDSELMFSQQPNHLGVEVGACRRNGEIQLDTRIEAGDVLVLRRSTGDIPVRLGERSSGRLLLQQARSGDLLIRLVSQAQQRNALNDMGETKKFDVDMQLVLHKASPARLTLSDGIHEICVSGEMVQAAQNLRANEERIRAQMEKLGNTPFSLRNLSLDMDPDAHLSVSALNGLRRLAVDKLIEARMGAPIPCAPMALPESIPEANSPCELSVESGSTEILCRALAAGAHRVVFAPEDLRPEALDAALLRLPERFDLALPLVAGEKTLEILHQWAQKNAGRISMTYISNVGQMQLRWPGTLAGNYPLNIANNSAVAQLADWGLNCYTPSVELNRGQISQLGGTRQLVVYGALPLMQLRHCPLRATANSSGPHLNCRHCDHCAPEAHCNRQVLVDRTGTRFPLRRIVTPEGCVVQLLNSAKMMLLRRSSSLPSCSQWRMLVNGDEPVELLVRQHLMALKGDNPRSDESWAIWEHTQTTTGHYFRGAE